MNKQTRELMFSSKNTVQSTPREFFERYNAIYHFTLDVCATKSNRKCKRFISPRQDSFKTPWEDEYGLPQACWMNPPYGRGEEVCTKACKKKTCKERGYHCRKRRPGLDEWVALAYKQSLRGHTVVCLLPARTDTEWFHEYCLQHGEVEYIKGRLHFSGQDPAPFPNIVVVFRGTAQAARTREEVGRDLTTEENKSYWAFVNRVSAEVDAMPGWLKGDPSGARDAR